MSDTTATRGPEEVLPISRMPPRCRAWRCVALRRLLLVVLLGLGVTAFAGATAPPWLEMHVAEFSRDHGASWTAVALPDTWARRGLPTAGDGQYRLRFDLAELPREPWALAFARVSSNREVRLNGVLVETEAPQGRHHPVPEVIELPTAVLRLGANEIVVDLRYRVRGGLSAAAIGPATMLRARHDAAALWSRELPRSLNMGMGVLALLLLLVRWRRPSERALGLFGAVGLIGSVRNYTYFADVTLLPSATTDWLFFLAQIWTVVLFSAYAHSLRRTGTSLPLRGAYGAALGLSVLLALALPDGWLPLLRLLVYPLLLLVCVLAVRRVWQAARSHGEAAHYALVGSLLLAVLAGAHDYLFQHGRLPITGTFWLPFVMPVALGVVSILLLSRLVGALSDVERLNATLEQRVAERTEALVEANAAKTRFLAAASHDMRQPVVTIGLLVGLVREQVANSPPLRAHGRPHPRRGRLDGGAARRTDGSVEARAWHVAGSSAASAAGHDLRCHRAARADRGSAQGAAAEVSPDRAGGHQRSGAARPDRAQPGRQRAALHRARRGAGRGATPRRRSRDRAGLGHRHRHPRRSPVARIRGIRAARQPGARSQSRPGSGPGDRAPRRTRARASHQPALGAGARFVLHDRAAADGRRAGARRCGACSRRCRCRAAGCG